MLLVALLLTITNVLDKWFVTSGNKVSFDVVLSRAFTLSIAKCIVLGSVFAGLSVVRLGHWQACAYAAKGLFSAAVDFPWGQKYCSVPAWMLSAGLFEAVVLVLQLTAMQFTVAALVISIKRSGIVFGRASGWWVFK